MKKGHARSESLRSQVYSRLRSGLRTGGLGNQTVATERDLAAELGVSRTPIREALALLVHDGLVVPTAKGFTLPDVTDGDVANIYEVRRLLEPYALKSTVEHLSPADLKAFRASIDEQVAAHEDGDVDRFVAANSTFRRTWTLKIRNGQLKDLIDHYDTHIIALRELTLSSAETRQVVIEGLRQIVGFLERSDGDRAAQAMHQHLTAAEITLKSVLNEFS